MSYFSKVQIKDQYGFIGENTPMDEVRVAQCTRLVGATFSTGTTLDPNFWITTGTSAAPAAVTVANAQATVTTGATTTGAVAVLQSKRKARYIGGSSNRFRGQIQLSDSGLTNNTRRWGMFDGTDGAYYQLAGTTLTAEVRKTNTPTTVATLTGITLTNVNSYEIYITNGKVYFTLNGVLVATHVASAATWTDTMNLPSRIDNTNTGTASGTAIVYVRVATIARLGPAETMPTYRNITGVNSSQILKYGAGTLHEVIIGTPTVSGVITIYDNTTGTTDPITVITLPEIATPFAVTVHCPFNNGLNVVPSATGLNITIIYE
jgi:hypothetical protein